MQVKHGDVNFRVHWSPKSAPCLLSPFILLSTSSSRTWVTVFPRDSGDLVCAYPQDIAWHLISYLCYSNLIDVISLASTCPCLLGLEDFCRQGCLLSAPLWLHQGLPCSYKNEWMQQNSCCPLFYAVSPPSDAQSWIRQLICLAYI